MNPLEVVELPADRANGDVVAAFFFEDQRPVLGPAALLDWRLNGPLTELLVSGDAAGLAGEHIVVGSNGKVAADWILFVGGGNWDGLCEKTYRSLVRHLLGACRDAAFERVALSLEPLPGMTQDELRRMVEGALGEVPERPECLLCLAA